VDIRSILITITVCFLYRVFFGKKYTDWAIFFLSIVALFYYQPISTITYFDFWVPSISLLIGVSSWILVSQQSIIKNKENRLSVASIIFLFILFFILRSFPKLNSLRFINIPSPISIIIFVILLLVLIVILLKINQKQILYYFLIITLIVLFVIQKNELLSKITSEFFRKLNNQSTNLSSASEIVWIGYSYFAFRLLHVVFDSIKRGKINIRLHEFIGYLFFFPALLAGPIMRQEDFIRELRDTEFDNRGVFESAFKRIAIGLFQKFIFADMLALISMNSTIVNNISSSGWMWFVVFLYAFRIYFDFSGYTHIAIGIAMMIGITLPENFNKPLRSPTITIFWNNWHMTLTNWFRAYYFNPMTRYLRRNFKRINQHIILAFMQISTMILIGLWHGISWNFVFWGFWNGIGLFIQNQISTWIIKNFSKENPFWQLNWITKSISVTVTFVYISLGWVWFALPDLNTSFHVFATLMGK
jgi:alginate O-acetyltransferase complex protein AlgI